MEVINNRLFKELCKKDIYIRNILYLCSLMLKAYKYELKPNNKQKTLLDKHFGATRFLYNLALETRNYAYATHRVKLNYYDLAKQLTDLKKECVWLCEVSGSALQQSLINLETGFNAFFKGNAKYPNFKKKSGKQSYRVPNGIRVDFTTHKIVIPKFREGIKFADNKQFNGVIRSATISKSPTGKYFVSVLVETGEKIPEKKPITEQTSVGIDLGLSHFIITSDGIKVDNPKHLQQAMSHLKYLQRQASKKKKGGKNRKKANLKVAKAHERITNLRTNFLHHVSTDLVNNHDTICFEPLNIQGMVKNHKLAQAINSVSWGQFVSLVQYKAEWKGKNVLQIGTFDPSTKLCHKCGVINQNLTLKDREWTCAICDTLHDRDINAAINIKNFALFRTAGGKPVKKSGKLLSMDGVLNQKNIRGLVPLSI